MKQNSIPFLILLELAGLIYLAGCAAPGTLPAPALTAQAISPSSTPLPESILDDLRVRQAIAHCTDRSALLRAVYPWLEETTPFEMDSFLPSNHPFYAGDNPEFTRYPYDPQKGRALLNSVGWTLPAGAAVRVDAEGEQLRFTLTTTTAEFRKTWVSVFIEQMKSCGVGVSANHIPADQFYEGGMLTQRDFELAALARVVSAHPNLHPFSCAHIPSPGNEFNGDNFSGWCNALVEESITQTEDRLEKELLQSVLRAVQREYARDLPGLPLFQQVDVGAAHSNVQNSIPLPNQVYTWNAAEWEIPGRDVIVIGERSEPAGLHPLNDSWVNMTVHALIDGLDYVQRDYEYIPITLKRFPTVENGGAAINASGQLVATYEFIEGLTWSDGIPVTSADYQLAYRILCNPEAAGEYLYVSQRCEQIASVNFTSDTSYTITYISGYRDFEYFLPPIGRQPAHRITEDGMRLEEAPASYWTWLAEVNENPIGIGPYVLQSWEYGKQMVFTANPHYFGKPPVTPTIIIKFIPQKEIESYLLRGEIDIADSTSFWLGNLSSAILQAQANGKIRLYFVPSVIYEQLEFRLSAK